MLTTQLFGAFLKLVRDFSIGDSVILEKREETTTGDQKRVVILRSEPKKGIHLSNKGHVPGYATASDFETDSEEKRSPKVSSFWLSFQRNFLEICTILILGLFAILGLVEPKIKLPEAYYGLSSVVVLVLGARWVLRDARASKPKEQYRRNENR